MLAKYLKDMRASRIVSSSQALSTLGSGWAEGENGAIQKEFQFDDFVQASNFMNRYAAFCSKVNHTPEWANVYNRVNVVLQNSEFRGVTSKEVEIGEYLNTVGKVSLNEDVTGDVTFERVAEAANIDV